MKIGFSKDAAERGKGEMSGAAQNTNVEIWREKPGDFYADHIDVTKEGSITLCVGGTCITKAVQDWHALAEQPGTLRMIQGEGQRIAGLEAALTLADAALSGANMNMAVVERKVHAALEESLE